MQNQAGADAPCNVPASAGGVDIYGELADAAVDAIQTAYDEGYDLDEIDWGEVYARTRRESAGDV